MTRSIPAVKPRRPRSLSVEQKQQIIDAYLAGASLNDAAKRCGVHRVTVARVLEQAGIEQRQRGLTNEQLREAIQLYTDGLSTLKLGKHFGVNPNTVWHALKQAGVQLRDPHGRSRSDV